MSHDGQELHRVSIPENMTSRGTGEVVALQDATVFDFMPALIGSRFQEVPELTERVHRDSLPGPYMALQYAYHEYALLCLDEGSLTDAIDAYRHSLENATGFIAAISQIRDNALLNESEVASLRLDVRFGALEQALMSAIWEGEVAFHPDDYAGFVKQVKAQEESRKGLGHMFFRSRNEARRGVEGATVSFSSIGGEYLSLLVEMHDYPMALYVAKELGLEEEIALLQQKADEAEKVDPRLRAIVDKNLPDSW